MTLRKRLAHLPALAIVAMGVSVASCASGEAMNGGLEPPPGGIVAVVLSADSVTVEPSQPYAFTASGRLSDGTIVSGVQITWEASGGTISSAGSYTAGVTPGEYQVIATLQNGTKADTSIVTILDVGVTLLQLVLNPSTYSMATGETRQFTVVGSWSDGSSGIPAVTYSATGGAITPSGLYTAGTSPGIYRVIATQQGGTEADTAIITIPISTATLSHLVLSPSSLTLAPSGVGQFVISGTWSDGSTTVPAVTYAAMGGTITPGGLFTAGDSAGVFKVIATQLGGTRADTSTVTVSGPTLPAACQSTQYTRLISVSSNTQLHSALSLARPGDLIVLADGTYGGAGEFQIQSVSGTATQRITLCGSRLAVIDVGSLTNMAGLSIVGANFWTFSGFTITNALFGLYAKNSSYNYIESLAIHRIGQEGIQIYAFSKGNVIRGNTIFDTGITVAEYGEGIYIGSSYDKWCTYTACAPDASDSTLIEDNIIGPDVRAEHIDVKEGTTGGEIRNNAFDGRGMVMSQSNWPASWLIIQGNGYNIHHNVGTFTIVSGYRVTSTYSGWGQSNTFWANTADVRGADYGFLIQTGATSAGNIVRCDNLVLNAAIAFASIACQVAP